LIRDQKVYHDLQVRYEKVGLRVNMRKRGLIAWKGEGALERSSRI